MATGPVRCWRRSPPGCCRGWRPHHLQVGVELGVASDLKSAGEDAAGGTFATHGQAGGDHAAVGRQEAAQGERAGLGLGRGGRVEEAGGAEAGQVGGEAQRGGWSPARCCSPTVALQPPRWRPAQPGDGVGGAEVVVGHQVVSRSQVARGVKRDVATVGLKVRVAGARSSSPAGLMVRSGVALLVRLLKWPTLAVTSPRNDDVAARECEAAGGQGPRDSGVAVDLEAVVQGCAGTGGDDRRLPRRYPRR